MGVPKRKHSTQRKGKRLKSKVISLPETQKCPNCGKVKLPHYPCKYCGQR